MRWLTPDFLPADEAPSGLQFGDGLFETILYENGRLRLWPLHWARLLRGMKVLGLESPPDERELLRLMSTTLAGTDVAVVKLMVVRQATQRGYASGSGWRLGVRVTPGRPAIPARVTVCTLDYRLAGLGLEGIKHMNRLEQVLATRALAGRAWEGWVRTPEGEIVEGIRTNLLLLDESGRWFLPDCRHWGVNGTMRTLVSDWLSARNQSVYNTPVSPDAMESVVSAAIMNSIYGVLPVDALDGRPLHTQPLAPLFAEIHARIEESSRPITA